MVMMLFVMCHGIASTWHSLSVFEEQFLDIKETWIGSMNIGSQTWLVRYTESFYWALATIVLIGNDRGVTIIEHVFTIITIFWTVAVFAYLLSSISMILEQINQQSQGYKKDLEMLNVYMDTKKVHIEIQSQIRSILGYYHQAQGEIQNNLAAEKVLQKLPQYINDKINYTINQQILYKFNYFRENFSKETLEILIMKMSEQYLVTNQLIFSQNQYQDINIYLINKGTVKLFYENNEGKQFVFAYLKEGDMFGDYSFITGEQYSYSAQCSSFVTLNKIKRSDFCQIIKENKDDFERFSMIKNQIESGLYVNFHSRQCVICGLPIHLENNCNLLNYRPNKMNVFLRSVYNVDQQRDSKKQRQNLYKIQSLNGNLIEQLEIISIKLYNDKYFQKYLNEIFNNFIESDSETSSYLSDQSSENNLIGKEYNQAVSEYIPNSEANSLLSKKSNAICETSQELMNKYQFQNIYNMKNCFQPNVEYDENDELNVQETWMVQKEIKQKLKKQQEENNEQQEQPIILEQNEDSIMIKCQEEQPNSNGLIQSYDENNVSLEGDIKHINKYQSNELIKSVDQQNQNQINQQFQQQQQQQQQQIQNIQQKSMENVQSTQNNNSRLTSHQQSNSNSRKRSTLNFQSNQLNSKNSNQSSLNILQLYYDKDNQRRLSYQPNILEISKISSQNTNNYNINSNNCCSQQYLQPIQSINTFTNFEQQVPVSIFNINNTSRQSNNFLHSVMGGTFLDSNYGISSQNIFDRQTMQSFYDYLSVETQNKNYNETQNQNNIQNQNQNQNLNQNQAQILNQNQDQILNQNIPLQEENNKTQKSQFKDSNNNHNIESASQVSTINQIENIRDESEIIKDPIKQLVINVQQKQNNNYSKQKIQSSQDQQLFKRNKKIHFSQTSFGNRKRIDSVKTENQKKNKTSQQLIKSYTSDKQQLTRSVTSQRHGLNKLNRKKSIYSIGLNRKSILLTNYDEIQGFQQNSNRSILYPNVYDQQNIQQDIQINTNYFLQKSMMNNSYENQFIWDFEKSIQWRIYFPSQNLYAILKAYQLKNKRNKNTRQQIQVTKRK